MKIVVSSLNLLPLLFPLINDRFLFFSKSSNYEARSSFHFFSLPTIRMLIYFMRSVRALNRAANTATSSVFFSHPRGDLCRVLSLVRDPQISSNLQMLFVRTSHWTKQRNRKRERQTKKSRNGRRKQETDGRNSECVARRSISFFSFFLSFRSLCSND